MIYYDIDVPSYTSSTPFSSLLIIFISLLLLCSCCICCVLCRRRSDTYTYEPVEATPVPYASYAPGYGYQYQQRYVNKNCLSFNNYLSKINFQSFVYFYCLYD